MGLFSFLRNAMLPKVTGDKPSPCGQDATHYYYGAGCCPHCFDKAMRRAKIHEQRKKEREAELIARKVVALLKEKEIQ